MKTLATDKEARLTYLKRELVKLSSSAWWSYKDDHPDHPMVQRLKRRAEELAREIKELDSDTSHPG